MPDDTHSTSNPPGVAGSRVPGRAAAAGLRHPLVELLARYRAVLRAAWAARGELAGPRRLAHENAFLPAALSLQQTPPHPAPRRAIWALTALLAVALAWACIGQLDIVAVAHGRLVAGERSKLVQPLEASVVRAIHVRDGDHVRAGQLLVELDPTAAQADAASVEQAGTAAAAEARRHAALIDALRRGVPPLPGPRRARGAAALADRDAAAGSEAVRLRTDWADLHARLAQADAEVRRSEAGVLTIERQVERLRATLPIVRRREADVAALAGAGHAAAHEAQDRERERIEQERELATQVARLAESRAALQQSRRAREAQEAQALHALEDKLAEARLRQARLAEEAAKAAQRQALTRLVAPVSGTVQQLAVHTRGGIVTPAQVLMVVVPDLAGASQVLAEVQIENQDIGFVHAGQRAEVKLQAFPFTRYGTLPATLSVVAADAVIREPRPSAGDGPRAGAEGAAVFPALLTLERGRIAVDGRSVVLGPGWSVTAEIKTGRRRVIDYLLSPLRQSVDQSLRER